MVAPWAASSDGWNQLPAPPRPLIVHGGLVSFERELGGGVQTSHVFDHEVRVE